MRFATVEPSYYVQVVGTQRDKLFYGLLAATAAIFVYLITFIFFKAPVAQLQAGGLAQKIFYFHVPAAYCMYLCGVVCCVASATYLAKPSDTADAIGRAGAECAVVFGAMMLSSGPLWAKKAWGVYWTWDPRLTTTLLSVLVYVSVVVLRAFAGNGDAERKFASALGVLGTVILPIIHYSVLMWGGNHPTVIGKGGGGLKSPDMVQALLVGFVAMTLLAALLLWSRARLALSISRIARLEERAIASGELDY
ncbi:MAG TPA: cytochrome c biogenesis protein [Polyangiaceae bacterium]